MHRGFSFAPSHIPIAGQPLKPSVMAAQESGCRVEVMGHGPTKFA